MRVLLRGDFNEQSIIKNYLDTAFPDPSSREDDDIPNTLDELFSKFIDLDIQSTTLDDGSLQLDINPPRNQEYDKFNDRIVQLSMLLYFLKPSISESNQPSHELKIITYFKNFQVYKQLEKLPTIAPGLENLKINRRTGTPLKIGEVLIPADITPNNIFNFFHRVIDAKKQVGDSIFEKDNLLVEPAQPTKSKTPHKKTNTGKGVAEQEPEDNSDSDLSSVSTEPPSPPRTPDFRDDDDRTVNLYEKEEDSSHIAASTGPSTLKQDQTIRKESESAILPEHLQQEHEPESAILPKDTSVVEHTQPDLKPKDVIEPQLQQPESNPGNMGAEEHHKPEAGRVSPSGLTEVDQFSELGDDFSDTTAELHIGNEYMPNDDGRHSRQWYIDNAEAMNQYLQEDDIKLLEYLVDETADHMSMMDSLLWQRVTKALLNLHIVGELPQETVEPYLNAFHEAIRVKRHEYEAINGKKPAKPRISEEEIQAQTKQREQAEEQRQLENLRTFFEPGKEQELFDEIVLENQEGSALTEQGWNRLKQILELKNTAENWPEIVDMLIGQNLSESAWQKVDDFFIQLERLKDQNLEDEIKSLLNNYEEVKQVFGKLLKSKEGQQEFIRQILRDDILEFCQYVNQHPNKWKKLKQELLQAKTPAEIEQSISNTLSAADEELTTKKIQENSEQIHQAYMKPIPRTSSEILLTGLYRLHRETLVKNIGKNSITMLDKVLSHPAIDTPIFKHFWEGANRCLRNYLAAEYKQGDRRNMTEITEAKQELEDYISVSYSRATMRLPEPEANQEVTNLKARPTIVQLLASYLSVRTAIESKINTQYLDAIIAKIIEDGNDFFMSEDQADGLNNAIMNIGILNESNDEERLAIESTIQNIYEKTISLQGAALQTVKDLNTYIYRVSSKKFETGSDFTFFRDRRAKSRAKNCAFAKEITKQITENPQDLSNILSEENISKVKQKTGAKVTNSKELNKAIEAAQRALADTTQQQSNNQSRKM